MSAEEDTELRDLIIQTLENSGIIGKIKAELRASVFIALEEEGSFKNKIPTINKELNEFASNPKGKLVISLVREFLQFFNLNFTLSVFDPEVLPSADYFSRLDICSQLGLTNANSDSPLLSDIINRSAENDYSKKGTNEYEQICKTQEDTHSSSAHLDSLFGNANPNKPAAKTSEFQNGVNKVVSKGTIHEDSDDSFFDEPLPFEKKSIFSFNKDNEQSTPNETARTTLENQGHSLKFEKKGQEKSSLSSLRDLPSLNSKNNDMSDWAINRPVKMPLPSLGNYDIHDQDGDFDEEEFQSSASGHSTKSSIKSTDMGGQLKLDPADNQDNSEQSIEEDIEEDLSVGVDDLLNSSLSLGDDVTTDQSVSQSSVAKRCDYMESCDLIK